MSTQCAQACAQAAGGSASGHHQTPAAVPWPVPARPLPSTPYSTPTCCAARARAAARCCDAGAQLQTLNACARRPSRRMTLPLRDGARTGRGGCGSRSVDLSCVAPQRAAPRAAAPARAAFSVSCARGLSGGGGVRPARTWWAAAARELSTPAPLRGAGTRLTAPAQRTQRVAALVEGDDPWWQHGSDLPNERAVHSTAELLAALSAAGDALVVCHFYAQWCGACKALHPKVRAVCARIRSFAPSAESQLRARRRGCALSAPSSCKSFRSAATCSS
jgi:hypothetical protein